MIPTSLYHVFIKRSFFPSLGHAEMVYSVTAHPTDRECFMSTSKVNPCSLSLSFPLLSYTYKFVLVSDLAVLSSYKQPYHDLVGWSYSTVGFEETQASQQISRSVVNVYHFFYY